MRVLAAIFAPLLCCASLLAAEPETLPGTEPLKMEGDITMQLVAGVDKFLLRKIEESDATRAANWKVNLTSAEAYSKSLADKRRRLANILGVRDARVPFDAPQLLATPQQPGPIATGPGYEVFAVRWPAFGDVHGEGLLLVPKDKPSVADIVAIPDADQTPEQVVGLTEGIKPDQQFARQLVEAGARVLVVNLVSRRYEARQGRAKLTDREFIYRPAFELGRHIIGYELQKVFAAIDWFAKEAKESDPKIGVMGYGEGGMLAAYAAAIDTRVDAVAISGYIGEREKAWQEPADRNVFGLLNEFGDAEVLGMILPRKIRIDCFGSPLVHLPSEGGAPGRLQATTSLASIAQLQRLKKRMPGLQSGEKGLVTFSFGESDGGFLPSEADAIQTMLKNLDVVATPPTDELPKKLAKLADHDERRKRQLHELDRHNQQLLAESPYVRAEFMKGLDTSSPEAYVKSVEPYREKFKREVIGWFDDELLPANPRTRKIIDHAKYTGYEVVLDVWPEVIAYGVLLLPKEGIDAEKNSKAPHPGPLPQGEGGRKRPVVVCQHGLEGRPLDCIQGDHSAYHDFAAKLAERGFITFCPQNLYIGQDKFRTLQRKANPLGKTLFSIIIPQHQQIVAWLKTLPQVDDERIAFYGLSYGGKSAMRIPPLVPEYCLSICSADFNDWVWKNASTRSPYSYVWTGEYEIFEWDLGSTFSYAEMATLIAPRPFMVERGHGDGVAPDEAVGAEFAKVYRHYNARLKIGDRCEIEWFDGPHTINGKGTFKFLHKHLQWPEPAQ